MTGPDGSTPEGDVAAAIDALRRSPERRDELVALLPESAPLYAGRTSAAVTRLRGWLLAAFADTGLPAAALPYALEALESGDEPYEVAGAAIAVRGTEGPAADVVPYLLRAIRNLSGRDATVSFESYDPRWPFAEPTTAATEARRTIAEFGSRAAGAAPAGCGCAAAQVLAEPSAPEAAGTLDDVALEDQDGQPHSFAGFFRGKPSVVAFFYTRCDNPYKCSLTVTKLAAVQALLDERGLSGAVRLAAITYDPQFDIPKRLKGYGSDRGLRFGDDVRAFRTTSGTRELSEHLGLEVNFGPSTVNRHQIEVYILDGAGAVAASFTRLQWEPDAVLAAALRCARPSPTAAA